MLLAYFKINLYEVDTLSCENNDLRFFLRREYSYNKIFFLSVGCIKSVVFLSNLKLSDTS